MASTFSVTHVHLLQALLKELSGAFQGEEEIRILDAGCGQGVLTSLLHQELGRQLDKPCRIFGFDVADARVQKSSFIEVARARQGQLESGVHGEPPPELSLVNSDEPWPYPSGHFHAVVSNQVLEHVKDIDGFFGELARVLRADGISLHLFPLERSVIEGHTGIPYVHRLVTDAGRAAALRWWNRLRLPGYGPLRYQPGMDAEQYVSTRVSYLRTEVAYRTLTEFARAAHRQGLRIDTAWTLHFYILRVLLALQRPSTSHYRKRLTTLNHLTFWLTSRVSSSTLRIAAAPAYDPDDPQSGHR